MSDVYKPVLFAGDLNRRVVIEQSSQIDDGLSATLHWSALATVWANVVELAGRESLQASQTYAEAITRFQIRYRDDVKRTYRLKYQDRIYDIISISELGVKEGQEILATFHAE